MQILGAQCKWTEIIAQYGAEDLNQWPFWQIGEGAFARGKGYYFTKDGKKADADFQAALNNTPDTRIRLSIRTTMAHNRESNLHDETGALPLYLKNVEGKDRIGAADEFRSLERAAAILTKQGKFTDALGLFDMIDFERQTGYWLHAMLISKGHTLVAAGREDEAKNVYRRVLSSKSASDAHRKVSEKAIKQLDNK
jgi:tetratricopeptide (TPR) repeat protein